MTAAAVQQRLDSWKEIAAHLGRRVRTVQRGEREEGLPVRRHAHRRRGTVYAWSDELDTWFNGRQVAPGVAASATAGVGDVDTVAEGRVATATAAATLAESGLPGLSRPPARRPSRRRALFLVAAAALVAACGVLTARLSRAIGTSVGVDPDWALTARYLVERGSQAEVERARDLCSRQPLRSLPTAAAAAAHECLAETTLALVRFRALPRPSGLRSALAAAERSLALDDRPPRA